MPFHSTLAPTRVASLTAPIPTISSQPPKDAATGPALPTEVFRQIFSIARASDQNGVETYRHRFRMALAVSHVSQRWNAIALGQPELWSSVSISRSAGQSQDTDTLHDILSRSRPWNVLFEVSYRQTSGSAPQADSVDDAGIDSEFEFWKRVFRPGTNAGKYSTFRRFKLVYVWGGYDEVHSVLKALARYSELTSLARSNPLPIEYLKAMVSHRDEDANPSPDSLATVEPFSVCRISSRISNLSSRGLRFFEYPQWAMDRIVLEDVEIDTKHIRILVAETGARRLTLRGVTIPAWTDIDSAHPSALSLHQEPRSAWGNGFHPILRRHPHSECLETAEEPQVGQLVSCRLGKLPGGSASWWWSWRFSLGGH